MELIIIDGASTDNTVNILKEYGEDQRIKWVSEPDNGTIHAFNKGMNRAKGDLIGIQQSSDTYEPGIFSQVLREFTQDPLLAMVGGSVKEMDVDGKPLDHGFSVSQRRYITTDDIVAFQYEPPLQAAFFRRDLALSIGGFDEDLYTNHDYFFSFHVGS